MTEQTRDDSFHEIQLNGKQLVFLFMAATVVLVVSFLCGVLVGRGVSAERAAGSAGLTSSPVVEAEGPPSVEPPPPPNDPAAALPPPVSDLSYFNRLEKPSQPRDELKSASPGASVARDPAPPPDHAATASTGASTTPAAEPVRLDSPSAEPAGPGFALQVTALRERSEAEAVARRLSAKGYTAYVLASTGGVSKVYRVRIGKFKTRREAEAVASKLQQEEQLTPWITR